MVKRLESLFRDFIIGINRIDHEESENRGTEMLASLLYDPGSEILKTGMILKFLSPKD